MRSHQICFLLLLACFAGCTSKITETVDEERRAKLETIRDCLPPQLEKLLALLEFANLWRLNQGTQPADPSGLAWSQQAGGTIQYSLSRSGFTINGNIDFYSPTGVPQNLTLVTVSLSAAIDDAATQLRTAFASGRPFMVADWSLTGAGVSGGGVFTGLIGGSSNGNELEELRTTAGTPPLGGPPALAPGVITTTGSHSCTLEFLVPGLRTDDVPGREYPSGQVEFDLTGPEATVAATMTLNGTAVARIVVQGLKGFLTVNLDTLEIQAGR